MPKKSNTKGSSFERKMAKTFSSWYSRGERTDIFWRTEGSGARATNSRKRGNGILYSSSGDMRALDPIGEPLIRCYHFEFKCYKFGTGIGYLFSLLGKNTNPTFWKQWDKTCEEAFETQRAPFYILKLDGHKELVFLRKKDFSPLYKYLRFKPQTRMDIKIDGENLVVFRLEEFLTIDPDRWLKLMAKGKLLES